LHFQGNAPSCGDNWIDGHNANLTAYFFKGSSGFTTPTWNGVNSVDLPAPSSSTSQNLWITVVLVVAIVLLLVAYFFLRKPKAKK
jgi:membrane protein DedA with SNARE-associated domain